MEEKENVEEMITSKEAARLLGVSEGWMRKCRSLDRGLDYFRIGGIKYERSAVIAFRESCRVKVAA